MNIKLRLVLLALFLLAFPVQMTLAATVDGNAFKVDQTDHSDITIVMETLPPVPTIGFIGIAFLLAGLTLLILKRKTHATAVAMFLFMMTGLICVTYALATYSTITIESGAWDLANVDPGDYRLDASAPGYYPFATAPVTIITGANTVPDIYLYPIPEPTLTPTVGPTDTPTLVPTDTPTQPPTETPTMPPTDTPTETPTAIPTDTPTAEPTDTPSPSPTDVPTETPTVTPIQVSIGNMILVIPGTFTQGSPVTEIGRGAQETQFTHVLTNAFYAMETEVTRQMWADLLALQPSLPGDPSDVSASSTMSHPAQNIIWYEAILFCNLLSLQNGYQQCYFKDTAYTIPVDATNYLSGTFYWNTLANGYRLPSEGEWEYLCRGGTTTPFSCPEPLYSLSTYQSCVPGTLPTLEQYCVYCANGPTTTDPVGSKLSNPLGFKDVHGNVWEWCWDIYNTYPTGTAYDYTGPGVGTNRIMRGGSWWFSYAQNCRSANRSDLLPTDRYSVIGFRIVRLFPT